MIKSTPGSNFTILLEYRPTFTPPPPYDVHAHVTCVMYVPFYLVAKMIEDERTEQNTHRPQLKDLKTFLRRRCQTQSHAEDEQRNICYICFKTLIQH